MARFKTKYLREMLFLGHYRAGHLVVQDDISREAWTDMAPLWSTTLMDAVLGALSDELLVGVK